MSKEDIFGGYRPYKCEITAMHLPQRTELRVLATKPGGELVKWISWLQIGRLVHPSIYVWRLISRLCKINQVDNRFIRISNISPIYTHRADFIFVIKCCGDFFYLGVWGTTSPPYWWKTLILPGKTNIAIIITYLNGVGSPTHNLWLKPSFSSSVGATDHRFDSMLFQCWLFLACELFL